MASFASAFAAMKSFLNNFADTDTQRAQAAALLAQGKKVVDFLEQNQSTSRTAIVSWSTTNRTANTFASRLDGIHDTTKAAFVVTETKLASARAGVELREVLPSPRFRSIRDADLPRDARHAAPPPRPSAPRPRP